MPITPDTSTEQTLKLLKQAQKAINGNPTVVQIKAGPKTGHIDAYELSWKCPGHIRVFYCAEGTVIEQHSHPWREITCLLSGHVDVEMGDGEKLALKTGDSMIIEADKPHSGIYRQDSYGAVILFTGPAP